ncbi:MAG: nitrogenase molybdenum-iron protein [Clostridiales bacterium]|nr:nitrogenase molybdenum-iron protein [Clostridiales bacterium]
MKGLLKYLSPFAPDQSGAVSVLYDLGGMIVICDAGGCTGNFCGFDEPRWFEKKSAIFSAGLRDMDAILGRDDRLVEKLKDAADHLDAKFIALIGTPVPAVIATDFKALKRMTEKKTGLPVIVSECTGTRLYDKGAEDAYLSLFQTFAKRDVRKNEQTVGVIGVNPLDTSYSDAAQILESVFLDEGYENILCYGAEHKLESSETNFSMKKSGNCMQFSDSSPDGKKPADSLAVIEQAGTAAKNIVLAPSGIRAAKYLQETFGTPYETAYPLLSVKLKERLHGLAGKRVLVVHQQVAANEIRKEIAGDDDLNFSKIVCGTWFMQVPEQTAQQDVHFEREETFISYVEQGNFDAIVADGRFRRALRGYRGEFVECPHFAVSGTMDCEL